MIWQLVTLGVALLGIGVGLLTVGRRGADAGAARERRRAWQRRMRDQGRR